jgi:molybdenum cofactor cytidylyltransferase
MKLHEAFQIVKGDVIAFVGAGGKTSTLVGVSRELQALGWRALATTTTRIAEDELQLFPQAVLYNDPATLDAALNKHGCVFAYAEIRGGKVYGLSGAVLADVMAACSLDAVLIEADGARRRLLKAPYSHEPVIPPETTLVVSIASFLSVGLPLDEANVYNPEALAGRFGAQLGDPIRAEWLAEIIGDSTLGLKNVPPQARAAAFINRTPAEADVGQIARLALRGGRLQRVAFGSAQVGDPVFEVVEA